MLQRYDISMDCEANQLSITEFALLGRISRKREHFEPATESYSLLYKATYEGDMIRGAIRKGREALISEIRSDGFFPIRSCVEVIVEKVIELFGDNSTTFSEVFFDDRDLFFKDDEND